MKTNSENSLEALKETLPVLEGVSDWTLDNIHNALFALIEKLELKNGRILWPLRVAVSGKQFTPGGGVELAEILGKDETLKRIAVSYTHLDVYKRQISYTYEKKYTFP